MDPTMITSAAQAATGIAQTVSNIIDQTKRRQFEQAISLLSNQQQENLNKQLLATQSQDVRMQILSSALLESTIAAQQNQDKSNNLMIIIAATLAIFFVGAAIFLASKKHTVEQHS